LRKWWDWRIWSLSLTDWNNNSCFCTRLKLKSKFLLYFILLYQLLFLMFLLFRVIYLNLTIFDFLYGKFFRFITWGRLERRFTLVYRPLWLFFFLKLWLLILIIFPNHSWRRLGHFYLHSTSFKLSFLLYGFRLANPLLSLYFFFFLNRNFWFWFWPFLLFWLGYSYHSLSFWSLFSWVAAGQYISILVDLSFSLKPFLRKSISDIKRFIRAVVRADTVLLRMLSDLS